VFGDALYEQVPRLWEAMSVPLAGVGADGAAAPPPPKQAVVDACQLLRRVGARVAAAAPGSGAPFAEAVKEKTLALLEPAFAKATAKDADPATQRAASAALAALAAADPDSVVPRLLTLVIPALENAGEADDAAGARRGAAAVAFELVRSLGPSLAPFCVLLLVPLMGRMSDPVDRTREMATKSFAALVPLLPLARGRAPPATLTETQRQRSESDGAFLEALLDNSKVEDFVLPFECNRTLRPYQQEGVNWLAFLRRFKLHGALCDDMGLGKTLQSTCILAATVVERKKSGLPFLPALVVCPPTLVGHWAHEINEYVAPSVLKPLEYHGSPADRAALRPIIEKGEADVVIMSYDSLRADADALLTNRSWCYCILDEGHAIRNPKSRVTQAVKKVRAENRLLLSGTPIQNDVVELWSLFDFLMPGFLGTEKEFRRAYGIAAARSVAAKKGGGLTEQGALAHGASAQAGDALRDAPHQGRGAQGPAPEDHPGRVRGPVADAEAAVRRLRGERRQDGRRGGGQGRGRWRRGRRGGRRARVPGAAVPAQAVLAPPAGHAARREIQIQIRGPRRARRGVVLAQVPRAEADPARLRRGRGQGGDGSRPGWRVPHRRRRRRGTSRFDLLAAQERA
jgi:TATA-binding protein-associated factor